MSQEQRLAALEARLLVLEDEREIERLIASYGPAVDSDSRRRAAEMWVSEGVYDVDVGHWRGHDEIAGMLGEEFHQGCLADGCSHVVSLSRLSLDGDTAVATGYLQLIVRDGDAFVLRRQTAQRWELTRTASGWKIARRYGRLIDGTMPARELLSRGLDD